MSTSTSSSSLDAHSGSADNAHPSAARTFYDTPELWHIVLSLLDQHTLTVLMRLHQAAIASVGGVLYRKIHLSVAEDLFEDDPRDAFLCNAVRIIDRNPIPLTTDTLVERGTSIPRIRRRMGFNPAALLKDIAKLRHKFPYLQILLNDIPHPHQDSYTTYISDEKIAVHLETVVVLDIFNVSPTMPGPALLPPSCSYDGMSIEHALALKVIDARNGAGRFRHLGGPARRQHIQMWKSWLYSNPSLDKRVSSIDTTDPFIDISLSFAEAKAFILKRKRGGCVPINRFYVADDDDIDLDQLLKLIVRLGKGLRTLALCKALFDGYDESAIADVIEMLDAEVPELQQLQIQYTHEYNPSLIPPALSRLAHLRFFVMLPTWPYSYAAPNDADLVAPARWMCRMGSKECVYAHFLIDEAGATERFLDTIKVMRAQALRAARQIPDRHRGTAVPRVLFTPILLRIILSFLDQHTLAVMMRVERRVTAGATAMLYKEIPESMVGTMSRDTPRGATMCDAVQIIDRNPPPTLAGALVGRQEVRLTPLPSPFDPAALLIDISTLRQQYPNLHTLRNDCPPHLQDTYITYISDEDITVHLESIVVLDVYAYPPRAPGPHLLPPPPTHAGMTIVHTLALKIDGQHELRFRGGSSKKEYDAEAECAAKAEETDDGAKNESGYEEGGDEEEAEEAEVFDEQDEDQDQDETESGGTMGEEDDEESDPEDYWLDKPAIEWKRWLYCNEALDRRVSSIDHTGVSAEDFTLTHEEVIAFLTTRKTTGCTPINRFYLSAWDEFEEGDLPQILPYLCDNLRTLAIYNDGCRCDVEGEIWEVYLNHLNRHSPRLQELQISYHYFDDDRPVPDVLPPLIGLPHLRSFTIYNSEESKQAADPQNFLELAVSLCRLGSRECVYQVYSVGGEEAMKDFSDLVKGEKMRALRSARRQLRKR